MARLDTQQLAERLITLIEEDKGLDDGVRHQAGSLRDLAARNADAALERLDELAAAAVPALPLDEASDDLAKCIGIEKFWQHYLRKDVKAFLSPSTYRLEVERDLNPGLRLASDLSANPVLLPAQNSWLVRWADIATLSGAELRRALSVRSQPPFSVLFFPLSLLTANGVRVRETRGVDAVPQRLDEWRPGGLPSGLSEFIDRDVPRAALGAIDWRA